MITGKASSYGDAKDMAVYQRELAKLLSEGIPRKNAEARARKVGDPGVGWCDNILSNPSEPWIALPREDWQAKFKTKAKAHKAKVAVTIKGKTVICWLGDTMPSKANITNGAVIDLAPGAQAAFGLKPPFMVNASWQWA